MAAEERRLFVTGLLLGLLLSRAARALLSTLYFESLVTLRLNGTAFWTLVLLAPVAAPLLRRARRPLLLVGGVASSGLSLARFADGYVPLAALAVGALLAALPLLGVGLSGVLAGVALDAALVVLDHGHDPTLTLLGALAMLAATLAMVALAPPARAEDLAPRRHARDALAGVAIAALLAVEWAFLASPYAAARWAGLPAWLAGLASLFGLVVGATRLGRAGRWLWALGVLALVDVAHLQSPIVVVSLALLQAALGASAARLAASLRAPAGAAALGLALAPLVFVLLYFREPLGASEWGLLVPTLALVAALPALAWPRPMRVARAPAGAAAAAIVVLLLLAAIPSSLDAPPVGREFTVASWNIRQAFGNEGGLHPELYARVLEGFDADVVVLQESDTARLSSGGIDIVSYLADHLGMRAAYGRSGVAVLSRFPLADVEPHPATAARAWFFEAALDTGNGTLWVHGVHLARSQEERLAQARAIVEAADARGGARILAGDLNSCPQGPCFGIRVGQAPAEHPYSVLLTRYEDTWVAAGHEIDDPEGNTHHSRAPARRIDVVLVHGLEVIDATPVLTPETQRGSDHLPNLVRLRLPAE